MTVSCSLCVLPGNKVTVTGVTSALDPETGNTEFTVTFSQAINMAFATDLKASFVPVVSNSGQAVINLQSVAGLTVGQALTGIGIPTGTTIVSIDSNTNQITLSKALGQAAINQITNAGLIVSTDSVTSSTGHSVTLTSVDGYKVGDVITGDPSIPANAIISQIDSATNTITYTVSATSLNAGGSMNNLTTTANAGANGVRGQTGSNFGMFDAGEGLPGSNGTNGANGTGGVGGNGGNGGYGSNGLNYNPNLIVAVTVGTLSAIASTANFIADFKEDFIGSPPPLPPETPPNVTKAIADTSSLAASYVSMIYSIIQLANWQVAEEQGLQGLGGNGGYGGAGGAGSTFFGGGAGGNGGNGGAAGCACGIGGTPGDGGAGGAGGFGAGGGSGGAVGIPGPNGDYNSNGSAGAAGFGGGFGSVAGANGQGGSGYGGAIFVRAGGTLNINGNAIFQNNQAFAGGSSNGGSAGQAVGNDLFMMTGSHVTLTPGTGNTITFWDSIADDSSASISGTSIAAGQGASITIGGGGTVQFFGPNTYTGTTIISGATLEAADGAGVNASSHVLFDGQGTIGDLSTTNAGVWLLGNATSLTTEIRAVGLQPGNVSWTDGHTNFGSGGFAALAGGLTLNLGSIHGGAGPTLTWNQGGFVKTNYTLVFGSDAVDATGTVTLDNAINLNSLDGKIAVYHNSGSTTDGITTFDATLAGVLSGGTLTVGSAGYTGSLLFSAKNSLTGLTVNSGTVSNSNGTVAGRLFDSFNGGSVTINGGMLTLGGAEKLTTVHVAPHGILGATAAITAGDITNAGTMVFGNTLNVNSVTNSGLFTLLGATTLYGAFTNQANGTVMQTGAISGAVGSSVSNSGVWNMAADISVPGTVTNDGMLNVIGTLSSGTPVVETAATRVLTTSGFSGSGTVNLGGTTGQVANTLVINQSNTTIFSGAFTGAGGLTKNGTGSLHLSGANSFTGPLQINAGVLALDAGGSLASTLDVTVGTASVPTPFADFSVQTASTIHSVTNYSTVQVSGGLTLATFTNKSDGTATIYNGGSLIASGAVSNAGEMDFNAGSTGTLSSTLFNSGTLNSQATLGVTGLFTNDTGGTATLGSAGSSKFGSLTNNGTFTSSSPLTVTGAVINTGTMTLNDPSFGSLTNSGTINLNDTLDVGGAYVQNAGSLTTGNNANLSTGSFSGTGGSVVLNGTSLFTINQTANGTYSGSVSGTGSVLKGGSATLTLSGTTNSFAPAALEVYAGGVTVTNASILGGALPVATDAAGTLTLLANQSIGSLLNNGTTKLEANLTTSGMVTDNGTLNVIGTLAGSPVVETAATRTLTTADFIGNGTVNLGGLSGNVANTLIINQSGNSLFSGSFTGAGGLTKTGAGTLALDHASTFTGPLAINGGTLYAYNNGTFADTVNATVGTAGTFIAAADDTIASLTNNGKTEIDGNFSLTTFTDSATGTATVYGALTASGAVSNAGSLTFEAGSTETLKTTLYNSGTLTSQGALGVTGLFTNDTGATATLGSVGSNTFGGLTNNGTINASNSITVNGAINNTGSLSAAGFSGSTLTNSGSITSSSLIDIAGAYVQNAGSLTTTGGLSTGSLSGTGGAIHLDNNSAYILNQTTDGSFAGSISGTGGLLKYGNANLTLTGGVDSFAPSVLDIFAGQVIVANPGILDHALNVAVSPGAGLTLQGDQIIHDLTGAGNLNLGSSNLTLASGGNFSGPITGTGNVKIVNGDFTLGNGSSVATNTLNVDGATLNVVTDATAETTNAFNGGILHLGNGIDIGVVGSESGTLKSGTLNINGGGSLTGNGTVNGNVFVGGGSTGTLAPGNSPGIITVNNVTFDNFSVAAMQIDGAAGAGVVGGNDLIVVNGRLVLQAGSTLAISKSHPASTFEAALGQQIQLFNFAPGAVSGHFGSATLSSDFAKSVIFNLATGSVIGLGDYSPAQFQTAVATSPNQTAIMNELMVDGTGGVRQYYGGKLLAYVTDALASGAPGAVDAAFARWSPDAYAGILDQMQLSVLDNRTDLASYDQLTPGRTYAIGAMTRNGMDGVHQGGSAQNIFRDTAFNTGIAHQFAGVEVSLSYGHTDGGYHGANMQATVVGNQFMAGASAPVAFSQKLRVMAQLLYGDYTSHGTRVTNGGNAAFGGVKSHSFAYDLGVAYHQAGATQLDVSAEMIGMSETMHGFTETAAATGSAGVLDRMSVAATDRHPLIARLKGKMGTKLARSVTGFVDMTYDHQMSGQLTPITGNVAVETTTFTVKSPGLARDRVSGGAGLKVDLSSAVQFNVEAKGGSDAAYNFGGGVRLSF